MAPASHASTSSTYSAPGSPEVILYEYEAVPTSLTQSTPSPALTPAQHIFISNPAPYLSQDPQLPGKYQNYLVNVHIC